MANFSGFVTHLNGTPYVEVTDYFTIN